MNKKKINASKLAPVLLAYIVMGFVDIVGVSVVFAKADFNLTDDLAQLIPFMAFLWFFVFSVPTGILQDRWGKRNTLNLGMAVTGLGMALPFVVYSFPVLLAAFVLLGIGNTIVQVSANPLLKDVVASGKFASFMSLSQFIKAISSLLGPVITAAMASYYGTWKLVFAVYAVTSLLAVIWLYATKIDEYKPDKPPATFKECFSLLNKGFILKMVIAIFLIVGLDVGMNSSIANFLVKEHGLTLENASLGISIYFTALMIGRFSGAVILNWLDAKKFLKIISGISLLSLLVMMFAPDIWTARVGIFLVGLFSANFFPLVFSITIERYPTFGNEISGLMIMAISGGAVIPPLIGFISTRASIFLSLFVLMACIIYVMVVAFGLKSGKSEISYIRSRTAR